MAAYYSDSDRRAKLLQAAKAFCASFAQKTKTPAQIVEDHFSSSSSSSSSADDDDITAYEHGLPGLAPFLGRAFRGREGVRRYFEVVGECLGYEGMRFPAASSGGGGGGNGGNGGEDEDEDEDEEWVVDVVTRKVSVKGSAEFTWKATGESWSEVFAYVLAFDGDVETPRVRRYEVWADTGAAWLARTGQLGNVRREAQAETGEKRGELSRD